MARFWQALSDRRFEDASELQLTVNRAREVLHIPHSTNAACYEVLRVRGVDVGYPRPPILRPEAGETDSMVSAFKALGML
jgi:dihydrodipicolinate synthase/N-acetylneuraminate lyase